MPTPDTHAAPKPEWNGGVPHVAILGAGFSGLCLGLQLQAAGFGSFTIFEKSEAVGGTWHDNTYPGAGCDIPSHLYSFSFEPRSDWSRKYPGQAEILAYIEDCVRRRGLEEHLRLGTEIVEARFDEERSLWRLRSATGESFEADILVSGTGQLNRPYIPPLPGLASFEGTAFHSARWDHGHDLHGRNVAVIGNGASAIQFIPKIVGEVASLTIFQRTPNWVVPRRDRAYGRLEKALFRHLPGVARLYRSLLFLRLELNFLAFRRQGRASRLFRKGARLFLREQVPDRELRKRLVPDYPVGCKRVLISDDYYPALQRPNVSLVEAPIEEIRPNGIATADGTFHACDTILFATGFATTSFLAPIEVVGPHGQRLQEAWQSGAEAYLGLLVPDFPNLFLMYGPNTNLGHNSILFMIECQSRYILQCLRRMVELRARRIEVQAGASRRYQAEVDTAIGESVWAADCESWYKNAAGRVTNNWYGFATEYWWRTRQPEFADLTFTRPPSL